MNELSEQDTATAIRALLELERMAIPEELRAVIKAGEPVWDTTTMQAEFEVLGFLAPLVAVRRRSDGKMGSLKFSHRPRYYFGFAETR